MQASAEFSRTTTSIRNPSGVGGPEALTKAFPAPRLAVDYVMDTFAIVRRNDEAKFDGDYRTKRVILEIYDALAEANRHDDQPRRSMPISPPRALTSFNPERANPLPRL